MTMARDQHNDHPPVHCGKPMVINSRINRVSGPRIVYRCTACGKTVTIKDVQHEE
jgi:predicted SprT family Zn-dependent metalloprotease